MTIVARCCFADEGAEPITLMAPAQRHYWVGDNALLLGFPASPEGVPWNELPDGLRREIAEAAGDGSARLKGSWTLFLSRAGELIVRTDPFGTRPLFVRQISRDTVAIADEIWSLLDPMPELDIIGMADFLLVGHHLGSRTIFTDISMIEADSLVRIAAGGIHKRLLSPPAPLTIGESLDDAVDALEASLLHAYNPYRVTGSLLVGLSGGLDSRVVLATAVEQGFDVHAWTFTLYPDSEEERLARSLAQSVGVGHTVSFRGPVTLIKEALPFIRATSAQLSLEHIHAYGSRTDPPNGYEVAAWGLGGEAHSGAYLLPLNTPASQVVRERVFALAEKRDPSSLQTYLPGVPDWSDRLHALVERWYENVDRDPRRSDYIVLRNRLGRFLVWGSLSVRDRFDYIYPLLDEDVIRVTYGMPEKWQRGARAYRRLIHRRWPSLGRIHNVATGSPLSWNSRLLRLIARKLRPLHLRGRPLYFTGQEIYQNAFSPLSDRALAHMTPLLKRYGLDIEGLIQRFPNHAGPLRLRLISLYLALHESEDGGLATLSWLPGQE
jgi:asparagine synthase